MKIIKIISFSILALIITIIVFIYIEFRKTSWGGWKPPSAEFVLSQNEINWKKKVTKEFECKVEYIGLESGFREDSIIYIDISFGDNTKLLNTIYDSLEFITARLSKSFIIGSNRKQKYIMFSFQHLPNHNLDVVIKKIPEWQSCIFSIEKMNTLPVKSFLIYNQFYYIKPAKALNNKMIYFPIGKHIYYYIEDYTNSKKVDSNYLITGNYIFKNLKNCQLYEEKKFNKFLSNGNIFEYKFNYVFYENVCISAQIQYKITPRDKKTKYREIVEFLSNTNRQLKTKKIEDIIKNYVNKNYIFYDIKTHGIKIKSIVDTLNLPWTINYQTSLEEFKFYYDMEK